MKHFVQITTLLLLLGCLAGAQNSHLRSDRQTCPCHSADLLYRPVVLAMWSQDEGEYAIASGYIRIAVHPTWSQEFFVDVLLKRESPPVVVLYSLPKGVKTVTVLLERELKQHPSADPKSLAKMMPMHRQVLQADKKIENLIAEFFALRWEPRRIPADTVRLDATEYELEYVGDDTLLFDTDDYETPLVKWMESLLSAIHDTK
jgi:hypothetical protein